MISTAQVKMLNPRSPDTKVLGNEPDRQTQPTDTTRVGRVSRAFSWYNYFYGKKDGRDMIVSYLEANSRKADVRLLKGVPDSAIRLTTAWLCRMSQVGLKLNEHEKSKLDTMLTQMLSVKQQAAPEQVDESKAPKITIQDRLRDKVVECAGEMEGLFDDFMTTGAKMSADYKPVSLIRSMNVAPQMISMLSDTWKTRLIEFQDAVAGKDGQLAEGYQHLSKIQLRSAVKFCEAVINDCGAYVQIKKVERKPRQVKLVSPEKRAVKFKIMIEFPELKLKSLPASSLVDKTEAWLYDTKKRKLIHVVANEYAKVFTVKNNTLIGFETSETQQKTVRKPAELVKAIQSAGKPAARKIFKDLTTTETMFNGRGTENLVILKTW